MRADDVILMRRCHTREDFFPVRHGGRMRRRDEGEFPEITARFQEICIPNSNRVKPYKFKVTANFGMILLGVNLLELPILF